METTETNLIEQIKIVAQAREQQAFLSVLKKETPCGVGRATR